MKAIISSAKLREVFPAFVIIDASGRILDFGPAIEIHASSVRAGDFLENHFSGNLHMIPKKWEEMARENGRSLELHSRENGLVLTGVVVADSDRFLLALNPATASLNSGGSKAGANPAPDLHISDFTPGDPAVDSLLLGWMHQAMLEDAAALATSLARERQRNDGLVERVSRLAGFLAHDFNNILSIIQLNANRLASLDSISTRGKRLASMIGETAERGSGITRSLMTISRENTEKPAPHSADDLITQHLSYFSAIAGSDIVVSANLDASSAQINISISEFINCLTNLVINSRDAICDPGVIDITTRIIG
jgi:signal transduction histidine kinase